MAQGGAAATCAGDRIVLPEIKNPPDDAVFIWSVGSNTVLVCCRAAASLTDRRLRGPDYFSGMLQFFAEIDDYHRFNSAADDELRCTINLAENCTAQAPAFSGGTSRLMPLQRGQFILLWRDGRAEVGVLANWSGPLTRRSARVG